MSTVNDQGILSELATRVDRVNRDLADLASQMDRMNDPVARLALRQLHSDLQLCKDGISALARLSMQRKRLEDFEEGRIESSKLIMRRQQEQSREPDDAAEEE